MSVPADTDFLAALAALETEDPTADTLDELPETLDFDDDETTTAEDDSEVLDQDAEDEQDADEVEEPGEDEESEAELYTVKVDGEELEVSLEEMAKGYMRQAKFTKEMQGLKAKTAEFEQVLEQVQPQLARIDQLDAAWDEDPSEVLGAFVLATEDPNLAIIEQVKRVAAAGRANDTIKRIFGITDEVQAQLRAELNQAEQTRKGQTAEEKLKQVEEQQERDRARAAALAEYEAQITEIVAEHDIKLPLADFRRKLSKYAIDNELTNLKLAYRLMSADEEKSATRTAAKTQAKRKAATVAPKGAAGTGSTTPRATKPNSFEDAFDASWSELGFS